MAGQLIVPPVPPIRDSVRIGLIASGLFVAGFFLWALIAPISSAAVAPGQIKVEGNRKTIQHLEGGIIDQILVHEGDTVTAGQVLMRLNAVQPGSAVQSLTDQQVAMRALDARLSAERDGTADITFPPDLLARDADPQVAEAIQSQKAIFTSRQEAFAGQISILGKRGDELRAEIDSHRAQMKAIETQLGLIRDELAGAQTLYEKGYTPKTRILALERTAAGLEGSRGEQQGLIARAQQSISETELNSVQLKKTRATEIATQQSDLQSRLADIDQRLRAASDIAQRTEITAPISGAIVNLRYFTVGGVVRPGEPIMDIVPNHTGLVVEAHVRPSDVTNIFPGMEAQVRLSSFKQRVVPVLHGKLLTVSADALHDQSGGEGYYTTEVAIDPDELARLPDVKLVSGMPAQVIIPTGKRTLLEYLMEPLRDSFIHALREK